MSVEVNVRECASVKCRRKDHRQREKERDTSFVVYQGLCVGAERIIAGQSEERAIAPMKFHVKVQSEHFTKSLSL